MARELTLEAEEWYVLRNWLHDRENRLMYAVRSRSAAWAFVHDLRRSIDDQCDAEAETSASLQTVTLADDEAAYLVDFLRRRSIRLRFLPWRDRERRDVIHLRRRLRDRLGA